MNRRLIHRVNAPVGGAAGWPGARDKLGTRCCCAQGGEWLAGQQANPAHVPPKTPDDIACAAHALDAQGALDALGAEAVEAVLDEAGVFEHSCASGELSSF